MFNYWQTPIRLSTISMSQNIVRTLTPSIKHVCISRLNMPTICINKSIKEIETNTSLTFS